MGQQQITTPKGSMSNNIAAKAMDFTMMGRLEDIEKIAMIMNIGSSTEIIELVMIRVIDRTFAGDSIQPQMGEIARGFRMTPMRRGKQPLRILIQLRFSNSG